MIVPCRSAQNGVWQNLGNLKAREFPTSDLEQSDFPLFSNPSPPCKRGGEKRGKPPKNQGEKILEQLEILTPEANTRKSPPNSLGSGGPGCSERGQGGKVLTQHHPLQRACRLYTQLKWQRRLRHGAPLTNRRLGSGSSAEPLPRQATQAILRKSGSQLFAVFLPLSIHFSRGPHKASLTRF